MKSSRASNAGRDSDSAIAQVIVVMGVSGSGKTTIGRMLAKAVGGCFLEGDDFHPAANIRKMRAGVPLQDADRRKWLDRLSEEIARQSRLCPVCFVACSALKKAYRDKLRKAGDDVRFVFLTGPAEVIRRRMRRRKNHFMNPALLRSQIATLQPPADAVVANITPPPEEICRRLIVQLGLTHWLRSCERARTKRSRLQRPRMARRPLAERTTYQS